MLGVGWGVGGALHFPLPSVCTVLSPTVQRSHPPCSYSNLPMTPTSSCLPNMRCMKAVFHPQCRFPPQPFLLGQGFSLVNREQSAKWTIIFVDYMAE